MRADQSLRDEGFTIAEMLLALALLAVLLAAVPQALRLANRTLATALRFERATNEEAAWSFVRRKVGEAISLTSVAPDGTLEVAFRGTPQAMSFIAPAPGGSVHGLARFELATAKGELTLAWTSDTPQAADVAPVERRTIARALRTCRFRYFAPARDKEAAAWVETWTRRDELPALVELTLEAAGRPSPRAVIIALPLRAPL